ncbi:ABC-type phosphate/phosphonate transport system substrate-binding protein [Borreliella spielmanii]|uniref:ABC-type phosphate/phosphonate transport system substrate-binding protein n=1 Tax=Borreliella spielmanii TaxID=88916 RepID=A0ABR6P7D5_9SPIR|nr:complement regulator-acquiring protein [Borreliella spielmanii]MBB6031910.1 ABC-type phosphate/phosphonate transport system substrate-binding protein [Borreliella spielmanii]
MKKYKLEFIKLITIILFLCSCNSVGLKQELAEKIEKIINPVVEKIENDKKEKELEFDEMKTIFELIQKNDELCNDYRRQFYSSLEYNIIRITNIIKIFHKVIEIQNDVAKKLELVHFIKSIIDRGSIFVQNPLEIAILEINKRKDDLINFNNTEKLKDIKNKINKMLGMQQQWIKNIDKIIITYNDTTNLQTNSEELETYLKTTYENTLKSDSNEIYDLMIEIGRELQENL